MSLRMNACDSVLNDIQRRARTRRQSRTKFPSNTDLKVDMVMEDSVGVEEEDDGEEEEVVVMLTMSGHP